MNKWGKNLILASSLILSSSTAMLIMGNEKAQATTKYMKSSYVEKAKKGILGDSIGKINMTYGALKVKAQTDLLNTVSSTYVDKNKDIYYFNRTKVFYIQSDNRVNMIQRTYDFKISTKNVTKELGEKVKVTNGKNTHSSYNLYKVDNYYLLLNDSRFEQEGVEKTVVLLGTKSAIEKELTYKIVN